MLCLRQHNMAGKTSVSLLLAKTCESGRLYCNCHIESTVCEIVLSLAGHFKLIARHLIGFNYGSSPDIFKFCWTCVASPANFAYNAGQKKCNSELRIFRDPPEGRGSTLNTVSGSRADISSKNGKQF